MALEPAGAYLRPAQLDQPELNRLRALERELGVILIALAPTIPLASLNPKQISLVQTFEKDVGVIVLARRIDEHESYQT